MSFVIFKCLADVQFVVKSIRVVPVEAFVFCGYVDTLGLICPYFEQVCQNIQRRLFWISPQFNSCTEDLRYSALDKERTDYLSLAGGT